MLRRLRRRLRDAVLPEATGGTDQWQRMTLNRSVDEFLRSLDLSTLRGAEISGEAQSARPWREFTSLNFPEFDLCAPLENHATYDVVICEQVIEHVINPCAAARNLRGLTAAGGRVIVSTPFLIRVHELPLFGMNDYWRFTPRGLRLLLERAGLQVDRVDSWGNRACIAGNLDRWPAYRRWMPLRGEADMPVQVWAFATNPG
jgi:SAM-dependent methyltransferase